MLHTLQNNYWQAGILPQVGASIAFGRIRYSGAWIDVLRPTAEADYDNSSKASSFIMLPWANRIRDGVLRYKGEAYQLKTTKDDGTARHGDVRKRPWRVLDSGEAQVHLQFISSEHEDVNYPFAFSTEVLYQLDEADFIWRIMLKNDDEREMPAGFGFHPYFVQPSEQMPLLQVPANQQFELTDFLADAAPVPVSERLDFQEPRAITPDMMLNDLLTNRDSAAPVRLIYEAWRTEIHMQADPIFKHILVFTAPDGTVAVEPQTNANDGFNLHEQGIEAAGVFSLQPGERVEATVKLRVVSHVQ